MLGDKPSFELLPCEKLTKICRSPAASGNWVQPTGGAPPTLLELELEIELAEELTELLEDDGVVGIAVRVGVGVRV